jgi:glycosyltransferase 2 family protein
MTRTRAGDASRVAFAGAILIASGTLARRGTGATEARLFRAVNGLPDGLVPALWAPMQYGTFGTVPALAAIALVRRRRRLAVALGVAGTAAWLLAKAVKPVVGRGRPESALGDAVQRGKEEGDLGFPSGHAAVSAAMTVAARPFLSPEWGLLAASLAGVVPFARMYVGAHLPLDVVGGSALGLVVGSAVNVAIGGRSTP